MTDPARPLLIDLHLDLPLDVDLRRADGEHQVLARRHLPALRSGGIDAALANVWVETWSPQPPWPRAHAILDAFRADLDESGPDLALVRSPGELEAAAGRGQVALVLAAEGLGFLEPDPEAILAWHAAGLRVAAPTYNQVNFLGGGCHHPEVGLTPAGRQMVRRLGDLGIVIDLSHMGERSFYDTLAAATGPAIASHSNARALCDVPRNLTDSQVRALARQGGVVGINTYPGFVDPDGASLDRYIDHLLHFCDVAGVEHVGLGFDFIAYLPEAMLTVQGDWPPRVTPGLAEPADVPGLLSRLQERGLTAGEVAAVAGGNFLRVWRQAAAGKGEESGGGHAAG